MILYAIGDIHGCLDPLERLIEKIEADRAGRPAKYVFLGDYIDRGPNSARVVETIVNLQTKLEGDVTVVCLRGNHEQMMMDYIDGNLEGEGAYWIPNGGKQTIDSYKEFDGNHTLFYNKLQWMHRHGDVLFVHAGIDPNVSLEDQTNNTMLWERQFNDYFGDYPENVFVVHGHTPVGNYDMLQNQLNIDTGCVFARMWSEEYRWLTCVKIESPDDRFKNDETLKFSFIQAESIA